jgi:hypothetical protein
MEKFYILFKKKIDVQIVMEQGKKINMKEIYILYQSMAPQAIHVEDGIIKFAPKHLSNFINQPFSIFEKAVKESNQKFIIEKVEE